MATFEANGNDVEVNVLIVDPRKTGAVLCQLDALLFLERLVRDWFAGRSTTYRVRLGSCVLYSSSANGQCDT